MDKADLEHRFTYHQPSSEGVATSHEQLRRAYLILALRLNEYAPDSREKSVAMTALEDSLMWGNAAIARNSN